jgi:hypothetical protein
MRRLTVVVLALCVGASLAACDIKTSASGDLSFGIAAGKAQDTWSRSYKLADKGRLELINVNGKITAVPTEGPELVVEARRTAKASSDEAAKAMLEKLEIREEASDASVRIESRPPRLSGFSNHEIEWTLKVPKGIVLDLRTTNGGVRLENLSNEVHAKTTNGGVKGVGLDPSKIDASAVNGGIELALAFPLEADDSVEMETVNGGVMLELLPESKASIEARCVNGGVHVDNLEIKKDQEEGSTDYERRRRLTGTMNGGGGKVRMSTTNGGVHISQASAPKKTT